MRSPPFSPSLTCFEEPNSDTGTHLQKAGTSSCTWQLAAPSANTRLSRRSSADLRRGSSCHAWSSAVRGCTDLLRLACERARDSQWERGTVSASERLRISEDDTACG